MNTRKEEKIKTILKRSHEAYLDGDFERVIQLCDEALLLDPECYQVWDDRGLALLSLNKEQDAAAAFHTGAKLRQSYYFNHGCFDEDWRDEITEKHDEKTHWTLPDGLFSYLSLCVPD